MLLVVGLAACGDDGGGPTTPDVWFELDAALTGATFFDAPFPSDVRLDADGTLAYGGFPNAGDAKIVRSTIDLAHNLGLTVVAEGVETAAIQDRLRALACDEAQGYHIARPLPVDDFLAWQARQG